MLAWVAEEVTDNTARKACEGLRKLYSYNVGKGESQAKAESLLNRIKVWGTQKHFTQQEEIALVLPT